MSSVSTDSSLGKVLFSSAVVFPAILCLVSPLRGGGGVHNLLLDGAGEAPSPQGLNPSSLECYIPSPNVSK